MDIGLTCAKFALTLFNLVFAALGIAMVVIGIGVSVKLVEYHDFIDYDLVQYPIVLIVVGCVVFFIAYLGCCGAMKENTCMLFFYAIIMIVLVVVEFGIIHVANSKRDQLENILDSRLNYTLHHAEKDKSFYASWDLLQTKLNCCGIDGPNDWDNVLPGDILPGSCCHKPADDKTCNKTDAIQTGCKSAVVDFLSGHIPTLVGITIGAIVFQLLAIIFPCCLFSAFRRDERLPRRWNRESTYTYF